MSKAGGQVSHRARGLDRAFDILTYIRSRREPVRPNDIAVGIGAPRSSVYELVNLLLQHGALEYSGGEGRVFLGRTLFFLGKTYAEHFDFVRECEIILNKLALETRETAQMCMLDGRKYTVAMMREGARPFRISSDVRTQTAIPWTASGRLLVAHLSDAEILELIEPADFVLPCGKALDPATFIAEARQAARDGYFDFDSITDSFTHCFAAPVYQAGKCIATLCLIAPKEDAANNHKAYVGALVREAAALSHKLGGVDSWDSRG